MGNMKIEEDHIFYLSPKGPHKLSPDNKVRPIDISFGPYVLIDTTTPEGSNETVKVSLLGSVTLPAGTIIKGHSYHV